MSCGLFGGESLSVMRKTRLTEVLGALEDVQSKSSFPSQEDLRVQPMSKYSSAAAEHRCHVDLAVRRRIFCP